MVHTIELLHFLEDICSFFTDNKESDMTRRMHLRNARSDRILDLVDTRRDHPQGDGEVPREPEGADDQDDSLCDSQQPPTRNPK
jgi:hypothetical protein